MNTFIEKLTRRACPEVPMSEKLSFLKYNTTGSIDGLISKVIFLAFRQGGSEPFACVKTVRKAADRSLINDSYKRLQALTAAVAGSPYAEMFPTALCIEENEGISYSVESALTGYRYSSRRFEAVLEACVGFQRYLSATNAPESSCRVALDDIIRGFGDTALVKAIVAYAASLPGIDGVVARVPQHGDVTPDNLFIGKGGEVRIIDCEFFGACDIAGFDIYHFLRRTGFKSLIDVKARIDPALEMIGGKPLSQAHFFLLYISELSMKKRYLMDGCVPQKAIADFESLCR